MNYAEILSIPDIVNNQTGVPQKWDAHKLKVRDLAWSRDGQLLCSISDDGMMLTRDRDGNVLNSVNVKKSCVPHLLALNSTYGKAVVGSQKPHLSYVDVQRATIDFSVLLGAKHMIKVFPGGMLNAAPETLDDEFACVYMDEGNRVRWTSCSEFYAAIDGGE